jgi:hypothetical protein
MCDLQSVGVLRLVSSAAFGGESQKAVHGILVGAWLSVQAYGKCFRIVVKGSRNLLEQRSVLGLSLRRKVEAVRGGRFRVPELKPVLAPGRTPRYSATVL